MVNMLAESIILGFIEEYKKKDNNKILLISMDITQSFYTLSNNNKVAEMMFLFNIGLSHLINKLSLISIKNLLVP